jgi:hypothetical protein
LLCRPEGAHAAGREARASELRELHDRVDEICSAIVELQRGVTALRR